MIAPPYPPACRLEPGHALELGAWLTLSVMVGGLAAHAALLAWRRVAAAIASFRARRLSKLHPGGPH